MVEEEVVDHELPLLDVGGGAGTAATHLLVEDGASHAPAEHQMQDLAAVEAGVEHAYADRNHGQGLALELPDQGVGIGHVRGDYFRVAALVLGVALVQILRETRRVMLGDGEHNRFARTGTLAGRQLLVGLPREAVELSDHQAVALHVRPAALELDRVVVLVVDVGPFGQELSDAGGESVGHEVAVSEGVLDRVGDVGRARLALVEVSNSRRMR